MSIFLVKMGKYQEGLVKRIFKTYEQQMQSNILANKMFNIIQVGNLSYLSWNQYNLPL
jgi:hypothetical protein